MPRILPFRAIRYRDGGDLTTRIAPPYDVLDAGPKQALLARDPHNVVAIDLPVTPPKTVGPAEAYAQAGQTLQNWLSEGVLACEDTPSLFAYEQVFELDGSTVRRRGLFAAVGVEEFNRPGGGVFRHEHTLRGGTDDRLLLMQATKAQLSAVFGVYADGSGTVTGALEQACAREPIAKGTTDFDGVEHRLWRIDDPATVEAIAASMESTDLFIADGHHRYTTALNYHKQHPDNPNASTCLFLMIADDDPGLVVLATHRLLSGLKGIGFDALSAALCEDGRWNLQRTEHGAEGLEALAESLPHAGHHAVGLYDPADGSTAVVTSNNADPLATSHGDKPQVWRNLDVAVLHAGLIDEVIAPRFAADSTVAYKYPHELSALVDLAGKAPGSLGIVVQPTPLQSVCDVARADGVMPPKSTFFYPKVATGLVIQPLD